MPARRLNPEERALWAKVISSVRPLRGVASEAEAPPPSASTSPKPRSGPPAPPVLVQRSVQPGTTLDGSWDRRLGRGLVQPEMAVDLHGHTLATAYAILDERLDQAISGGVRVLLLITGKPPKGEPPIARGRIRAAVGDWLQASRHAGSIAAVRNAHPRHGGNGALYIILRRRK